MKTKNKQGCYFKGRFVPLWGGVYTNDSVDFNHGGLDGLSRTIKANSHDAGVCVEQTNKEDMAKRIRIRKLTQRTCFRLQGLSDADIDKIKDAGISDSQCYKLAGNSICVPVLEAIFTQMFRKDSDALF